ncbi:hypothetical protein HDU87_007631 [Geranomyces variabilis]|uniref:Sterol regulatory element-binding protein cleavage-activating protein n=1 Tax=Geranomyces variabilis TaxID=109894 RepID=A0AAD5TDP0_9FUNG|nr:hypothetical protein HDU87_007631 [Geranomyces variabilis]
MDSVRSLVRPAAWDRQLQAIHSALESLSSGAFYRHGLFCASHPYVTLFFSFVLLFFLSSPIVHQLHVNLVQTQPATKPVLFWETTSPHTSIYRDRIHEKYGTVPFLRLEQIVINVTQAPTSDGLAAVRGAVDRKFLDYAMDLQQKISVSIAEFGEAVEGRPAVGSATRKYTLSDICYKPHGSDRCLVHSPLEYWASDAGRFKTDRDYLSTLSNTSVLSSLGIPIPLPSVFGGVRLDGMTGSIVGAESLLITYFLIERNTENNYGESISDVWDKLWDGVTLPADRSGTPSLPAPVACRADGEPKLLYYEFGRSSSLFTGESLVLGVMYLIVFLYISLVLGKVDLVKSKFALGFGAVVTVFSGLIMSVGLCSMLGVKTSLVPWEALPFLIIVVGVENISVLTNAVVKTSLDLPVKERVGLGLSKVGASMTLSLGGEMLLLLIASTTSIPALQEFCLFAAVSIVMDYFMQITFFITILSIDIRRLELSDLHKLRQAQSVTSAPRLSSATTYTPPGESPPEILEAAPRRRPHWASYLIIMVIVLLLGFGLSGSSSPMAGREKDISAAASSQENRRVPLISALSAASCENSMCSTADAFWHVIDPDRSAKYVEIRPSTFIMFDMAALGSKQGNLSAASQKTAQPNDSTRGGWKLSSLREPSRTRRFMTDAHPAIFMVTIVSLLLACVLLLVLLSGLTLMCMRMRRPFRRKYLMAGTAQDSCPRMSFDNRTWERSGSRSVLTIPCGDYDEVDAVTMVGDSVAWISSKTRVGYAFGREECRRRSIPRRRRGRRRGRIEVLATHAAGHETIMAIGTEFGWVEIWNLDSRSLLVEDSGPTCAAVTRLLFGTVDGSLRCFVGRADGTVSVLLAFPRVGGIDNDDGTVTFEHRHSGAIRDMYLNQRGFLYTASDDATACCWAASRNAHGTIEWAFSCLLSAHSARLTALACDPAADLLATGDADGDIFVWSTRTGRPLAQILNGRRRRRRRKDSDASERKGHRGAVTALCFAPVQGLGARNVLRRVLCSAGADELVNVWEFSFGSMQDHEASSSVVAALNRNRSSSAPTPAPRSFSSGSAGRRDSRGSDVSSGSSNGRPLRPLSSGGPYDADDDAALMGSTSGAAVVNLKHLGSIRQPGCTAITICGSLIAGVRTVPIPKPGTDSFWTTWSRKFGWDRSSHADPSWSRDVPTQPAPTLRAERGQEWAWQVWMTDVSAWEAGPQPVRSVVIGRDHLRGLGSRRAEADDDVSDEGDSTSGSSSSGRRKSSSGSSSAASAAPTTHSALGGIGGVRRRPRMADDSNSIGAGAAGDELGVRVATARRASVGLRSQPLDEHTQSTGGARVSVSSSGSDGPSTASTFNETSDSESADSASDQEEDDEDESDASDYGPSAATRHADDDNTEEDELQHLPVLQVQSIAVSDAGVAVAFGTTVKLLLFGGDTGSEMITNGGRHMAGDWKSFHDRDHGGPLSGKVHLA